MLEFPITSSHLVLVLVSLFFLLCIVCRGITNDERRVVCVSARPVLPYYHTTDVGACRPTSVVVRLAGLAVCFVKDGYCTGVSGAGSGLTKSCAASPVYGRLRWGWGGRVIRKLVMIN